MLIPTPPPAADLLPAAGEAGKEHSALALRGRAWWVLVAIGLACDFAMVPIVSSVNGPPSPVFALMFGCIGCTLAQGSLLAAWLVLAAGPFSRRLAWHWAVASGLWLAWFIGLALIAPAQDETLQIGFTVFCITPLVSLGAQLPLWAARHLFGWRLARWTAGAGSNGDAPLSIRDLFVATLVVAATFGLARVAPAFFEESETDNFWLPLFVGLAIATVVSTIAILPAAAMLLRPRSFNRALVYAGCYALSYVSLVWLIVGMLRWYGVALPPYQLFVGLSLLILSYAATCCLAAYVARQSGYYLTWRGSVPRSTR